MRVISPIDSGLPPRRGLASLGRPLLEVCLAGPAYLASAAGTSFAIRTRL